METPTLAQPATTLSLSDLREKFQVTRDRTDPFFEQWLLAADPLSSFEQQCLDRLKRNYENIIETNPLEEVVKLVVAAPLLDLAGFYQPPFSIRAEVATQLVVPDDSNQIFTGRIDVLVVKQRLWVLVIESKQSRLDVIAGIPQALTYLLSRPAEAQPAELADRFGMVTNGREVVFLKLQPALPTAPPAPLQYVQSRIYQVIEDLTDLHQILQGLKVIGQRILQN